MGRKCCDNSKRHSQSTAEEKGTEVSRIDVENAFCWISEPNLPQLIHGMRHTWCTVDHSHRRKSRGIHEICPCSWRAYNYRRPFRFGGKVRQIYYCVVLWSGHNHAFLVFDSSPEAFFTMNNLIITANILDYCEKFNRDDLLGFEIFLKNTDFIENSRLIRQRIAALRSNNTIGIDFAQIEG